MATSRVLGVFGLVCLFALDNSVSAQPAKTAATEKVSYYKQIRPIFQANCQGCHQPAKSRGEYIMTSFDKLLTGGASGKKAIVPGQADKSHVVELITPKNGAAKMPEGKKPLDLSDIELIAKWIGEGAQDDTPVNARERFDMDHPPVYTLPPIIASMDYSTDGKTIAVAGFHEVLLVDPETGKRVGRLVGMSERIQAVRFSPDGTRLAVAGGLPGRMGEIQVWDVAKKKLKLSTPVTYDTLFGLSWSPDGTRLSFGCTDNSVRVIDAEKGDPVMFQGGHSDWVLDTFFTVDGSHVVSASRDMSVKLTEIATQRLIDNVTSITPGALKGGVQALARHPKLNIFIAGGSDGMPRAYRIFRESARMIGDDANLIGELFPLKGRVFNIRFSADGKRIGSASSLDGAGEISVCTYDYTEDVPQPIKAIMGKVPGTRKPDENNALAEYRKKGIRETARIQAQTGIYALAFRPDGQVLATAGGDGIIRLYDPNTGKFIREFSPAPIEAALAPAQAKQKPLSFVKEPAEREKLPPGAKVVGLEVEPKIVSLVNRYDYKQLLITARLQNGESFDATRAVRIQPTDAKVEVTEYGLVRPRQDGTSNLTIELEGQHAKVPVVVTGQGEVYTSDFVRDVNPVLGRLGCNQGTCHGANKGRNGFKLSLRGVDALLDVRSFLDDHAGRRANVASPDDSLMLLKPTAAVAHVGGMVTQPGEPYYELIRNWIANGAKLNLATPRVQKIDISPRNPIAQNLGNKQQFRVLATYADGKVKDVTREAFVESGNIELATADRNGLVTALRRGEVPILARFEGGYTATTLLVMGDRTEFVWKDPPVFNKIDELTAAKWKRMKIQPSELCSDLEFMRRITIDLTGLPPTADEIRAFESDPRDGKTKRAALVERLIGSPDYVEYWTNKWADLLTVNRKYLGSEGSVLFRDWIKNEVAKNTAYDEFARKILTASGSNKDNPPASYFKALRDPATTMENTTHLFLGIRFNCNKCHDHPFERWTQDQYYETAAYFAQFDVRPDPASAGRTVGGTAVVGGKPLFEIVADKKEGEIKHDRTGLMAKPKFPFAVKYETKNDASRRQQLAAWISSADNLYFAKSYVNRLWGYLFGAGIIDPIDDIRAGNPPTNPELLDYLTQEFLKSGFNTQHVLKLIVSSRTYQLSVATNAWNEDDRTNYSHAIPRRLPAEVLYDSIQRVTGSKGKLGTRAASLPDSGVDLPSGFLATFGRPSRDSACECERSSSMQLGPVMAMVNGSTIAEAIADPQNAMTKLVESEKDDAKMINELFLRVLNRPAAATEVKACLETMQELETDHQKLVKALQKRELEVTLLKAKRVKEREELIAKAQADLNNYEKDLGPKLGEQEKQRKARIAAAVAELKKYEATAAARLPEWEKKQDLKVQWHLIKPAALQASKDVKLVIKPDHSIVSEGKAGRDTYTVTIHTDLKNISAVRLEAIADGKLPAGGPGHAKDGNFVLTELGLTVQPQGKKELPKKVDLIKPLADFSQQNFDIKFAVDGDEGSRDKGWAVSPTTGVTHWATFQLKETVGFDGGTVLTFKFSHQFQQPSFTLGHFRISLAAQKDPVGLSYAEVYKDILATAADKRTKAQSDLLAKYIRLIDPEYRTRQTAVTEASKPLPIDPRLQELKTNLELAQRPLGEDELLVQLRQDVDMSTKQLANRRLTAAQDIAWALINSPAFLFNH